VTKGQMRSEAVVPPQPCDFQEAGVQHRCSFKDLPRRYRDHISSNLSGSTEYKVESAPPNSKSHLVSRPEPNGARIVSSFGA
jgi:hypothetical protein